MQRGLLIPVALLVALAACGSEPSSSVPTSSPPATTSTATPSAGPTTSASTAPTTTASTAPTTAGQAPSTTVAAPTATLAPLAGLEYEVVGEANFPMVLVPDGDRELLGVRSGIVTVLGSDDTVLDISDATRTDGERGLLGMAVEPGSGDLFVHYSGTNGDTVVSRFTRSAAGFDRSSETVLLRVGQPAANHNGGMLQFDGSGNLVLGLGDGGGANDRFGNGQDFDSLLGGLVSIDPSSGASRLISGGLRNPWRFWIDGETGTIAIADVGQGRYEEVSIVPLDGTFYNFGWPITEATKCFSPASGCDRSGLTMPVVEIAHGDGGACSITGGIVYRGEAIPELSGQFFFSDLCGGWLRSVAVSDPSDVRDWTPDVGVAGQVISFGSDREGEIYVLTTAEILKLVPRR